MTGTRPGQRIDRWLWHARFVRTRTLAARLAAGGQVRLNRHRVIRASQLVCAGDVLTVPLHGAVRVIRVVGTSERRGSPASARALYEEIGAPPARSGAGGDPAAGEGRAPAPVAARPRGAGRPTKRDRRAIDSLAKGRGK